MATAAQQQEEHRINFRIDAREVRLIDAQGNMIGVVATRDALARAEEAGLDLVEIAPTATPPVCKILDYGKFKYEAQKKANAARKKQRVIEVKEIKMRPSIDDNDYNIKMRKVREFLDEGDKVKVTMRFRGREMAHQHLGHGHPREGQDRDCGPRQGRADAQARGPPDDHGDGADQVATAEPDAEGRAEPFLRNGIPRAAEREPPSSCACCACTRSRWPARRRSTGLRAMVDEIARVPGVLRAVVAVPNGEDGQVRFLAHVGKRGFGAHVPLEQSRIADGGQGAAQW